MTDHGSGNKNEASPPAGRFLLRTRLLRALPVLVAAALVFIILGATGQITPTAAVAAVLPVCLAALLIEPDRQSPRPPFGDASEDPAEITALHFADALVDPCLLLDHRSVVRHLNAPAKRQFPDIVTGSPLAFSLRHPSVLAAVAEAQRTSLPQTVDLHQTVPTVTWHKVSLAPLGLSADDTEQAERRLMVVTLQNFTEQKRVDVLRQDFVANVSHELRTPLTSLLGFIDTLLGPAANDTAVREKFLGIMRGQAERMARLVEDLLSLSRIEMRQHMQPVGLVDLTLLLAEVEQSLRGLAADAGLVIEAKLPEEPAEVTGDREELFEVFQNLLDNALKYGASGKRIDLTLGPASGRTDSAFLVTVTDYGAGVPPEEVPRLTERFYRVDAESSRKKKGTGLGLAIVKHIVTRHRGQLTIKSRPGEGMRVEVLLRR